MSANTTPSFLSSGYAIDKPVKSLGTQVALVLPVRTNGNGMPRDFLQQLFTVRIGRSQELLAEHDRHLKVDLVGVNAVFRLTDNDLAANAACEVKRSQTGIYLLLRKSVGLAVEIDKTQRVLEVTERGFYAPTEMIQFPNIRKRKGRGQRSGNRFELAVVQQKAANAEFHRIGRWEVPASAPRLGTYLAFLRHLQMNVAVLLVRVGLRGSDGKTDVAVQFAQGQLRHLSHGGAALLDANEKICVRFFRTMGDKIVAFKPSIGYYQRLFFEVVALQHGDQRADFAFFGSG